MPIQLPPGLTDDNGFIAAVQLVIRGVVTRQSPDQVWIIHIDNWFDHKWLRFSGTGSVASPILEKAGIASPIFDRFDSVKTTFYQQEITFPPFSPSRVIDQQSYSRAGDDYVAVPITHLPHGTDRMPSRRKLRRRIEDIVGSGCLFWYSGNTLKNGRGSLMTYAIGNSEIKCWFASFRRKEEWRLSETKGIDRNEVIELARAEDEHADPLIH